MKMSEAAPIIFKIIKNSRRIKAIDIARKSGIAIRRVYDVTILLESLKLVDTELPEHGWAKIYVWQGTNRVGKTVKFNSNQVKVFCNEGHITKIQNKPTEIIIQGSHNLTVENYVEFLEQ